jgi:hypothetical protein
MVKYFFMEPQNGEMYFLKYRKNQFGESTIHHFDARQIDRIPFRSLYHLFINYTRQGPGLGPGYWIFIKRNKTFTSQPAKYLPKYDFFRNRKAMCMFEK